MQIPGNSICKFIGILVQIFGKNYCKKTPTEPVQVEGRLWRQGNRQKKVHVVYPLMYNSIDSLIYQKHDEKVSRIDAIWEYRGDTDDHALLKSLVKAIYGKESVIQ